ncbi:MULTISPECIES: DUF418 domain-containing protein [unclassified Dysgonomonas]|uniref:DUF418 domain-containing protein n=1 Tax=unclassified Dysgonomonas TaxID=2630389 RepID=UPI00067FE6B8|nr:MULTISPECIES: DUF418 domain-containing protein [unclassified Dysgonomonas]MBD8348399.1 DUF418 domain-containing protein [Dysgonomonas sp. HGC4]MBF0575329.1 DUF418 domain-containing protein [Dysgonomonas sp. GY617]
MSESKRIDVADVLRGFAIMGIFLIHTIEHFNFYSFPEVENEWLKFTDKAIWDSVFFVFSGKAYGIFALLFGFSFFIQDNNRMEKGADFRPRFAWRLVLLFLWGTINAMFFTGEILVFFSIMGFVLLFVCRLSSKVVFIIATILMLQPFEWYKLISALMNPDYVAGESMVGYYFGEAYKVQMNGTFLETVKMNLGAGQMANFSYAWEYGRVFQTASLFMFGMLVGRAGLFLNTEDNLRFWKKALIISILCFFPLSGLVNLIPQFIDKGPVLSSLKIILNPLANLMFMVFIVSLIINLYYTTKFHKILGKLAPYGMMSLTAYITQSIVGSFLFYNWGLGLHDKLSITFSFLLGIVLFLLQYSFACWWMKRHKHGPLEYIWRKATWIGAKNDK